MSEHIHGARYASALQPVRDPLIFFALNYDLDKLPAAHSCNISKPWCMRCAKCFYVWISYCAWLPLEHVESVFGRMDLMDDPANLPWARQLLGIDAHTPFECVGQVDEANLAFRMAREKGITGAGMALLDAAPPRDLRSDLVELLRVDEDNHNLPDHLSRPLLDRFKELSAEAYKHVSQTLGGPRDRA